MNVIAGPPAPAITLDLSRLLSRAAAAVPTGIDRVELAYAEWLLEHAPERCEFAAMHPLGRFGTLPFEPAGRFVASLSRRWDAGVADDGEAAGLGRRLLRGLMLPRPEFGRGREARRASAGRARVYLLLSHHHLTRPAVVADTIARRHARFVPMVHDLIPLECPEYARPREPARHARRIETVVRHADAVLVPSEAVRGALAPHFARAGRGEVPIWVVPHGMHLRALRPAEPGAAAGPRVETGGRPYFVCLGTIEARKNHLLLLNIWRRLAEERGDAAPGLLLIGKRGWENEQVLDMVERCPALQGLVSEHNALPDAEVVRLLHGARALLFPSFAEGFGLPLAEALSLGVPAICSDIAVFREVGGERPMFLDPLDGLGWKRAVEARIDAAPVRLPAGGELSWEESIGACMRRLSRHVARGPMLAGG